MATLLYIQASPREDRSYSRAVADAFVDAYAAVRPDDAIVCLDLFKEALPAFDGDALQAKYNIMHGEAQTPQQAAAWSAVEARIQQFKQADKYLLAVPMWNFGIPYRLKQYLDLVIQPTYTFAVTADGNYEGLVTDRKALVVYARGGTYAEGTPTAAYDFQKPYLQLALGFMGITDCRSLVVEPTLAAGPDAGATARDEGIRQARELAAAF
jgi:FMN-dependent NADH-azoreductase